jgi:hypothetical protein
MALSPQPPFLSWLKSPSKQNSNSGPGTATPTPTLAPRGALGPAPSPCTPSWGAEPGTPTYTSKGDTPELRAALPTRPLTQWTEEEVGMVIKVLGKGGAGWNY